MNGVFLEEHHREVIERGAQAILAGTWPEMGWDFAKEISPLPEGWCDRHEALKFLERWYRERVTQPGATTLHLRDIEPETLSPVLPNLMVLDVLEEGRNCRYRVYGSHVAKAAGTDWTGVTLQEILNESGGEAPLFAGSIYRAVYLSRQPYVSIHVPKNPLTIKRWCRLILPVVDDSDAVVRFLVGDVAEGGYEPSGAEWVEINSKIRPHHRRTKR